MRSCLCSFCQCLPKLCDVAGPTLSKKIFPSPPLSNLPDSPAPRAFLQTQDLGTVGLAVPALLNASIYRLILLPSISQDIRYGLVARICRSHQSSSLPSAGKARVRFPVSESFFLNLFSQWEVDFLACEMTMNEA